MRVYGYTDDKNLMDIDLPIHTVVAHEIDPWRLDLFDPNPVQFNAGQTRLNFSRLTDVALVYKSGASAHLVVNDNSRKTCISSDEFELPVSWELAASRRGRDKFDTIYNDRWGGEEYDIRQTLRTGTVCLRQVKPSPRSYAQHLQEYLNALFGMGSRQLMPYSPYPSSCISVQGSNVQFVPAPQSLETNRFLMLQGEMLIERPVPMPTPPLVTWALETFKQFQPCIVGPAIWDALAGRSQNRVDILHKEKHTSMCGWLIENRNKLGVCSAKTTHDSHIVGEALTFTHNEAKVFLASAAMPDGLSATARTPSEFRFSADGIYCQRPGIAVGTRIALFDLAKRQTRALSEKAMAHTFSGKRREQDEEFRIFSGKVYTRESAVLGWNSAHKGAELTVVTPKQCRFEYQGSRSR